jgi:hypothetical protein
MKRKHLLIVSLGMLCAFHSYSQNDIDAMRYSQLTFGGTARFNAMAGSMGALGGDISTLSYNPAGIGIFRKSELTISPSVFFQSTASTYLGATATDNRLNFNLGNIGLVATFKLKDTASGWRSLNFGFGHNRTNNFYNRISTMGTNKTSSLLDTYTADAYHQASSSFDQFSTDLAYQTYLINPIPPDSNTYDHVIKHYGEKQNKSVETAGSMGETFISFGGNYRDRIFVGSTLGIVNLSYSELSTYTETDEKDTIKGFKSFKLTQNLDSKGIGVNFKLGVIVKATDWLRLGAAIHTPTRISMNDVYQNVMVSDLESKSYTQKSPEGTFTYSISTPFRAIASAGFIIEKRGLLNVEYEYVNYKNARLSSTPNVFSDVNTFIRQQYTSAGNLRIGGEVRLDPISFRAGYALYGSPFASGLNKAADRSSYTAGIGYRKNAFYMDFAYVLSKHLDYSYLYDPSLNDNVVQNKYTSSSFILSFGVRF